MKTILAALIAAAASPDVPPAAPLIARSSAPAASAPSAADIEANAPAGAWRRIAPENLMVVETAKGSMTVELAPGFAPQHVAAIRALVAAGRFDGGSVVRVQDNYVVQWATRPPSLHAPDGAPSAPPLAAEYERPVAGLKITPLGSRDAYAEAAGFADGWPVGSDGTTETAWLAHCYAMVGVGRGLPPENGDGSELYAVIGHAPRHLDRNMAVVGRVIDGLPAFAALPRGTEALGFYTTDAEKLSITRVRLASAIAAAERPRFEVMDTASPSFAAYRDARANRREPFFLRPAGAVDLCNVRVPVRRAK